MNPYRTNKDASLKTTLARLRRNVRVVKGTKWVENYEKQIKLVESELRRRKIKIPQKRG